jgi:two-component system LytT family response regulator
MRALIVDDERLARAELARLLRPHTCVEVIGEASNADEAEILIESLDPELLFLDIQMPGRNGFELLAALTKPPKVIFVTAYDEYALRAFEVSALDYLMKPVAAERLSAALARLSAAEASAPEGPETRLSSNQQVLVRDGERCWFVRLAEIQLFESEGNYTRLFLSDGRPLIGRSLSYLEARLDPAQFFRASRRHILNLKFVKGLTPDVDGGFEVTMTGGMVVGMSRRRAQDFRDRMSL